MKRIRTLFTAVALFFATLTVNAQPMSYEAMRMNARFLTDRMAYTLGLSADLLYDRLGGEVFDCANRKSRILVARQCVQGLGKDKEGRQILLLEPQPDFAIYPDEDGLKMVRSRQYDDDSPLDKIER